MKTSMTAIAAALHRQPFHGSTHHGDGATSHPCHDQAQIHGKLSSQGYTKINDLKFKDGMWHADARSADGNPVEVRIDPKTGKIYPNEEVSG